MQVKKLYARSVKKKIIHESIFEILIILEVFLLITNYRTSGRKNVPL